MPSANPVKVSRNDRVGGVVNRVLPVLDEVGVVTVSGGRSTVATMSQVADLIVAARPDVVLESVDRHQGATWTWRLPD
jgi:hypothetical protein